MVLTLDTPAAAVGAAPGASPDAGKPSLAGLGRAGLRAALSAAGVPDKQLRMRTAQLYSWLYVRGVTDFDAMTDVAKELRAELSRALYAGAPRDRQRAGFGRRHAQMAAAAGLAGARRRRARDRDGLHSRSRARHAVHFQPGRLHAQLHVLPYRHAAPRAQPHGPGDRRPDPAGARPHRRLGLAEGGRGEGACRRRRTARSPTSCSWAWASRCTTSTTSRRRWRSPPTARRCRCRSGASRCRPRASFRRSPAGARRPAPRSPSRCTRCAMSCATSWCRSIASIRSRSCSRRAATIRRCRTRGASPSSTSC